MVESVSRADLERLGHGALVDLVVELMTVAVQVETLWVEVVDLRAANEKLTAEVARLRAEMGKNSGNSSLPSSRDSAAERKRQAEARAAQAQARAAQAAANPRPAKPRKGKQRGAKGYGPKMVDTPDAIIDHVPDACAGCGARLGDEHADGVGQRRQVIDLPVPAPVVTEHRSHRRRCSCGHVTAGVFPAVVRAPVSYGPSVKAAVLYLLCRQHIPIERCREAMRDLYGVTVSAGAINNFYAEAGRRLAPFITALIALLKTLPVLHADETTDRVGTDTVWMHVLSTKAYTLIHASMTRGYEAIEEMGVLVGYRGVVIHDRLALYWKFKKARHGLCGAHLLRDLEEVAVVASQRGWAAGLARLLLELNTACDDARIAGHVKLAPALVREFTARYDDLVAEGVAANPEPAHGRKRDYYERKSYNLITAFAAHKRPILRFMNDLDTPFTNNQAERDLRPGKLHRKISGCFRSIDGAQRHAHVRSYLSTTRKHDIPAITALTNLFNDNPWMPQAA